MGRLFIIPCSQPQEAGARVGGTAAQILADNTFIASLTKKGQAGAPVRSSAPVCNPTLFFNP